MVGRTVKPMYDAPTLPAASETAVAEFEAGPLRWRAQVQATPAGVLAVGALITGMLLSTAVIVWAARSTAARRGLLG